MTQSATDPYRLHGPMTYPGRHADALLDDPPPGPSALLETVQGVLLHDRFGRHLYGKPPKGLDFSRRETKTVERRLNLMARRKKGDPLAPREPFQRAVGTCRDFALLLTALLREAGLSARVRCGFAAYLADGTWEDHWLCEYRPADGAGWRLADAQLDGAHRDALGIDFPPDDVPRTAFLTGAAAWRAIRAGDAPAEGFGHGEEARGLWFAYVNLVRDAAALCGAEVTAWDDWREAPDATRTLSTARLEDADRLADAIRRAPDDPPTSTLPTPPWL